MIVHFVVPALASPSGGNVYDERVAFGLKSRGWEVRVAGDVESLPDGGLALVDGLVASAIPQVLVAQANRLRIVPLMHMPLFTPGEREMLRAAAAVIVTSQWSASRLDDVTVHIARPGVDPAPLTRFHKSGTRLLCVAAVTPVKGHDVLVEALSRVDGDWSCVCVGPLDRDPAFVKELSTVDGRVRLVGPLVGAELAARYEEADLLVVPSRQETYGMVVTEALARAIPVLATDAGGLPEAMGHAPDGTRPGLLVPPGDADALACAIQRWLAEPAARQQLRRSAQARRATLTGWEVTVTDVSKVLTAAVSGARVGR